MAGVILTDPWGTRTPDEILTDFDDGCAAHNIAQARRDEGKNPWAHRLDVSGIFNDEGLTIEQKGRAIAAMIRNAPWFDIEDFDLVDAVEGLEDLAGFTEDEAAVEFDGHWEDIYDYCDLVARVWIDTF